jgi:hypothetical protein
VFPYGLFLFQSRLLFALGPELSGRKPSDFGRMGSTRANSCIAQRFSIWLNKISPLPHKIGPTFAKMSRPVAIESKKIAIIDDVTIPAHRRSQRSRAGSGQIQKPTVDEQVGPQIEELSTYSAPVNIPS